MSRRGNAAEVVSAARALIAAARAVTTRAESPCDPDMVALSEAIGRLSYVLDPAAALAEADQLVVQLRAARNGGIK